MSGARRVLVFQLHHLFGIHPIHHAVIQSLIDHKYDVDLVYADYPDAKCNLSQYEINKIGLKFYHGKNPFKYLLSTVIASIKIWRLILLERYDVLIVIEPQALIVVLPFLLYNRVMKLSTCVAYLSLEIIFMDELKKMTWKIYKIIEMWGSRQADIVVTQDVWRKELLIKENDISRNKMLCIPNCEVGESKYAKSYYLHDLLHIAYEKKILLCLGTPSFMAVFIQDLLADSKGWDGNWVLVVHSGVNGVRAVPDSLNEKVYFTSASLPAKDIGLLYQSADVGIAIYIGYDGPTGGKNLDCVGYSSGKFNMFLKYGKPVITTNQFTFKAIFEKSECGVAIESFAEIPNAMKTIELDYSRFSLNAIEFYNSELNIRPYINKFISAIS